MIFYGINPVFEALRSERLPELIYISKHKKNPALTKIRGLAAKRSVPVESVDNLQKYCQSNETQGVCAKLSGSPDLPFNWTDFRSERLVILDGLQDPHNFGAALRVCDVFGFPDVIFQKGNSCGITPAAIKASAGAYFHLKLYQAGINNTVKRLKESGFDIVVLDGAGDVAISEVKNIAKLCVIVGSEQNGVRFAAKRQANCIARIPMIGSINSLNVSCALAVSLYELGLNGTGSKSSAREATHPPKR